MARYLYKLMAYKDEYEVARLHLDAAAEAELQAQFGANWQSLIVAGQYTGHLNNGGEEVTFLDCDWPVPNSNQVLDPTFRSCH